VLPVLTTSAFVTLPGVANAHASHKVHLTNSLFSNHPNRKENAMQVQVSVVAEVLRAATYAADKHRRGPHRKGAGNAPYINHPLAVASLLANEAGVRDVVTLQAALLHDVVEETGTPLWELRAAFGDAVADVVAEVTDNKQLDKAERKRLQVENAPGKSTAAALVKAADKTCNLREILCSPPPWPVERKLEYFEHAYAVVSRLPLLPQPLRDAFDAVYVRRIELSGEPL
jgi:guanosine-3',5'-bis(diphosphate) 3'-pyrophosphohydrolase